jgi:nucleoside diphosphate kinase
LLPKRYEVSLGKRAAEDAVSRHYVGAVRDRFYGEGLKLLREQLLPAES